MISISNPMSSFVVKHSAFHHTGDIKFNSRRMKNVTISDTSFKNINDIIYGYEVNEVIIVNTTWRNIQRISMGSNSMLQWNSVRQINICVFTNVNLVFLHNSQLLAIVNISKSAFHNSAIKIVNPLGSTFFSHCSFSSEHRIKTALWIKGATNLYLTNIECKRISTQQGCISLDDVQNGTIQRSQFRSNVGLLAGGISIKNSFLTIQSCTFIGCSSRNSGGAMKANLSTIDISYSKFVKNTAAERGGALRADCILKNKGIHIRYSYFSINYGGEVAGAMYTEFCSLTLENSILVKNVDM